jgi:hypothetical protein
MGNDDISPRILNCGTISKSVVSFMLLPLYLRSFLSTPYSVLFGEMGMSREFVCTRGELRPNSGSFVPWIRHYTDRVFHIPGSSFFIVARWNSSGLTQDTLLNIAVEWTVLLIVFWRCRLQMSFRKPANLTADFRVFPYSSQKASENIASD